MGAAFVSSAVKQVDHSLSATEYKDYGFHDATASHMHVHFMPHVLALASAGPGMRVLDVGCGNGYTAGQFLDVGCTVVGIDLGPSGIAIARERYPAGRFEVLGAGAEMLDELKEEPFDMVVSTEVVEHLYSPRPYVAGCFSALRLGGRFICTTPYHGYAKNLVLSLTNHWDRHLDPLWDGGHIKMWSRKTLSALLAEAGFTNLTFKGVGRFPYVWMTMIMSGDRPR